MRKLLIISLLICLFSCNSKTSLIEITEKDKKEIIDREIKTWEYSKTKELDKLKEILAEDYVGYFGRKTMNENDVIQSLQKATVYSYRVKDIKMKPISESVAIIYYTANQKGVSEDGTLPNTEIFLPTLFDDFSMNDNTISAGPIVINI